MNRKSICDLTGAVIGGLVLWTVAYHSICKYADSRKNDSKKLKAAEGLLEQEALKEANKIKDMD